LSYCLVDGLLGGSDVELKDRSPCFLEILKLNNVTPSGYDVVAACENAADELFSESGGAARDEPSELRLASEIWFG
jgi:hypothetical protein